MAHTIFHAGLLALAWGCAAAAPAQTIYRCADSYSQQPCGDAAPLPLHDPRTPAQQAQARASALRAGQEADRLEAERLAQQRAAERQAQQHAAWTKARDQPKKGGKAKAPPPSAPPFIATASKPKPAGKGKNKGTDKRLPPADTAAPAARP